MEDSSSAKLLAELLKDPSNDVTEKAAEALSKIGPGAVPALMQALKDKNGRVRDVAAMILGWIKHGPSGESTVNGEIDQ